MKHFEGQFNGVPFTLLPWQRFVLASIFGFYYTDDPEKRLTEYVVLFVARKNAKTALSAAILLAEMCVNKEAGSEQYISANTRDQARIAYKFIKGYAKSLDPKRKHFKIYRDYVEYPKTNSICKVLSAEAGVQDGSNPSIFLIDENHAAQTDDMFQVLKSGQAMRKNPISIIISSGGYLMDGFPFFERIKVAHAQLDGTVEFPDSYFYALFELDPEDDWTDESVYEKANPSLGEIVQPKFLHERLMESMVSMTTQVDFKIKNLDIFVSSKNIWLEPQILNEVYTDIDLTKLIGEPCYAGCDLSATADLTSVAFCWPPNEYREYHPDKYLFYALCWIPQSALETANGTLYKTWLHQNYAKMTSGNSVDFMEILHDIVEWNNNYPIMKFHYDAWNATQFIQNAVAAGIPCEPMSQSLGSFNRGTKSLEILVKNKECLIHGTSLVAWCFNNVELKVDVYGNVKPMKANGVISKKIDVVIAIIEALSAHLFEQIFGNMEMLTLE